MEKQIDLIVERGEDGVLWGRVNYNDNLLVDSATSVEELEAKLAQMLKDFEDVAEPQFNILYDIAAVFQAYDFLKQSVVARIAGINPGLFRQYVSGVKHPSGAQAKKVTDTLYNIGKGLQGIRVHSPVVKGKKINP